ncbi:glycosyltransferase family 1 protein [Marasmius fiardii PR-910]|nr:glycosyltransferase family 1 protein [Marasmius fiardii PR-910]
MSDKDSIKDLEPLHMRELDDDAIPLIANKGHDSSHVDLGSIQVDPKINFVKYTKFGKGLDTRARIERDGSIVISLNLKEKLPDLTTELAREVKEFAVDRSGWRDVPRMNIVVMIVGSRGDVQPYVALCKKLLEDGHRVRIATHGTFLSFVEDHQLEFFDIGGDPKDLMSYMVKNPGLIPGVESLTNGDIPRKRKMLTEMMDGCWRSCHSPCPRTGRTFAADAIISNPPAFAHVHCAEALGIPLLMSFTMPWTPTTEFHHPLVNIQESNAKKGLTNYLSYALADILTWQGLGDIVNKFRSNLNLKPLSLRTGPSLVDTLKVPWTYCMSPALVPKPLDWKNHIDVVGFYFLDLATSYTPPDDLSAFLAAGDAPVYIGFGSVVVDDAATMTRTVFEATKKAGVRALVSAGWGGLGGVTVPPHIFILENIPHDWLFDKERVSAVVHHGGAGTTAAGLAKGRPTVVVPFFGDQAFWGESYHAFSFAYPLGGGFLMKLICYPGNMIYKAGAGPAPIHHKELDVDNLCNAIKFAVSPAAKEAAARMATQIREEDGVRAGVDSFYRHLPLKNMRCDLDSSRLAVWWSTEYCLKLSEFAAQVLADEGKLDMKTLDLHRSKEYETKSIITDPLTGSATSIFWTVTHFYGGILQIFTSPKEGVIETTTAIPRGVMKIVSSIHKGFHNLPEMYGSEVRQSGPVKDFSSGIREAGKGLYYGYYDGITGLVTEPWKGAQKEGFIGAIKGSARSFANVTLRPAAGIVGVVKHPMKGAVKSVQSLLGKDKEIVQQRTRISDGLLAVKAGPPAQKQEIIERFEAAKAGTKERQETLAKMAEKVMYGESQLGESGGTPSSSASVSASTTTRSASPLTRPAPVPQLSDVTTSSPAADDYEERYQRDLDLAIKRSLAE